MKHIYSYISQIVPILFLFLVTGCIHPVVDFDENPFTGNVMTISAPRDSATNMLVTFFQIHKAGNPQWKAKCDTASLMGEMPLDSVRVARVDAGAWYCILPVLR